jgi:hypothetical protein
MARIFILGAGASRFAGYPLGPELWAFIRDTGTGERTAKERAEAVIDAIERVLQMVPPPEFDRPDLEQLFTLLDLAEAGTEPLKVVKIDWRDLRPKLMGMIANAFQWHEYQLQAQLRKKDEYASVVLDSWAARLHAGDVIVTFNWALLHEAALFRRGKWHYADGYGFTCGDAPNGDRSGVKVLKLHGSVNWGQRDEQDCKPAIEHKADFFLGAQDDHSVYLRGAGQWNEGRYIIIPSYLKDLSSNRLLLSLWNQAFDALSTAEQVPVVGFQLHPADVLARQLLGCTLTRNPNSFALQVVSPAGGVDHWADFCDGIGRGLERIRMTFEDWVMQDRQDAHATPIPKGPRYT